MIDFEKPIVLAQLPAPSVTPVQTTGNLPLGGADLILFARQRQSNNNAHLMLLPNSIQNRYGDAALIDYLTSLNPRVIGFTCTVWNIERTLFIAEQLKQRLESVSIWLGGPEIARDSYFFHKEQTAFDLAVSGEGEPAFALLVNNVSPHTISGLFLPDGSVTKGSVSLQHLPSLDLLHDPFITKLIEPEADRVMYAEFQRGCMYACAFCRYHQGRERQIASRPLFHLRELFSWAHANDIRSMYLLDPSLEQRSDLKLFLQELAEINRNPALPLFIELRAEAVNKDLAGLLFEAGVRGVEVGLQTINRKAIRFLRRSFAPDQFLRGVNELRGRDIAVKIDIMYGLPFDTQESYKQTLHYLQEQTLSQDVQIFRTLLLPGTTLKELAPSLSIRFDQKPPYIVQSTPTWSEEELDTAILVAEETLDTQFTPDETPHLIIPEWNQCGYFSALFPGSTSQYELGFDLDNPRGKAAFECELFRKIGTNAGLWVKAQNPLAEQPLLKTQLLQLLRMNPFSSIWFALESESEFPLDVFDLLDTTLNAYSYSDYLPRLHYPTDIPRRPQRPLYSCFPFQLRDSFQEAWLDDCRDIATIIWFQPCADIRFAQSLLSNEQFPENDFLCLKIPDASDAVIHDFFECLFEIADHPQQLLFSGVSLQWKYSSFLNTK